MPSEINALPSGEKLFIQSIFKKEIEWNKKAEEEAKGKRPRHSTPAKAKPQIKKPTVRSIRRKR